MEKVKSVCEIKEGLDGSGYFSKELINRMMVEFKRAGRVLTDIYITQNDAEDVKEWVDNDISPEVREEIFNNNGIWNLTIHKLPEVSLDLSGKTQVIGFDFSNNDISDDQKLSHANTHLASGGSEVFCIGLIDR